jgi:hypothetical protein
MRARRKELDERTIAERDLDDLISYTLGQMYDIKCFELAVQFLEDHYDPVPLVKAQELAQEIQDCIEQWLEENKRAQQVKKEK